VKVFIIFGTRPEAIKMAPVIRELQRRSAVGPCDCLFAPLRAAAQDRLQSVICVTAQHRQMLDQVLELFGLVPDIDLNLMQDDQSPSQVAARVLSGLEPVLQDEHPDWVLVQGDTTTVMAAAIAAHHLRIKVGHVEAGLRSFDRANPFPEEMNRVVADHLSDLHFAPTEQARRNLLREGFTEATIRVTGNTVIEALQWVAALPAPPEVHSLFAQLGLSPPHLVSPSPHLILVTAHRRENFGAPLAGICTALQTLAARGDVQVVYPVHRNPHVWQPVHAALAGVPGITLLPPVDYRTLVWLLERCTLVLTDSGGIQEEAPSLGKPVLVLREVTERPEGVEAGTARVVGTDPSRIMAEASRLLDNEEAYKAMARAVNPYGDGHAAERIVAALLEA